MNIETVKNKIVKLTGKKITAKVNIGRNKYEMFEGVVIKTYPSLFTIKVNQETKSFSYADVLTKNIILKIVNT